MKIIKCKITGKSLSETLLFAEHGQGEHVVYKNCSECQKHFLYTANVLYVVFTDVCLPTKSTNNTK